VAKLFLTLLIFFNSSIYSKEIIDYINIKSDSIEFLKELNKINFNDNVEIKSEYINIEASSAEYDEDNNVISLVGMPTTISSIKKDNTFKGTADKIIFHTNEEVHLIGNASMIYENLTISSKFIIFNPITGKISSD
tara:strand:- start:1310 stop:1717 length:408 start_codon:yes stop_codon:yes gene_type:complete